MSDELVDKCNRATRQENMTKFMNDKLHTQPLSFTCSSKRARRPHQMLPIQKTNTLLCQGHSQRSTSKNISPNSPSSFERPSEHKRHCTCILEWNSDGDCPCNFCMWCWYACSQKLDAVQWFALVQSNVSILPASRRALPEENCVGGESKFGLRDQLQMLLGLLSRSWNRLEQYGEHETLVQLLKKLSLWLHEAQDMSIGRCDIQHFLVLRCSSSQTLRWVSMYWGTGVWVSSHLGIVIWFEMKFPYWRLLEPLGMLFAFRW